MKSTLSIAAVGHATSLFFAISFVLCVVVGLIVPAHNMAPALQQLLSGFHWISWGASSWDSLKATATAGTRP